MVNSNLRLGSRESLGSLKSPESLLNYRRILSSNFVLIYAELVGRNSFLALFHRILVPLFPL